MCVYVTTFTQRIPYVDTTSTQKSKMSFTHFILVLMPWKLKKVMFGVSCAQYNSIPHRIILLYQITRTKFSGSLLLFMLHECACIFSQENFCIWHKKLNYAVISFDVFLHEDFFLVNFQCCSILSNKEIIGATIYKSS